MSSDKKTQDEYRRIFQKIDDNLGNKTAIGSATTTGQALTERETVQAIEHGRIGGSNPKKLEAIDAALTEAWNDKQRELKRRPQWSEVAEHLKRWTPMKPYTHGNIDAYVFNNELVQVDMNGKTKAIALTRTALSSKLSRLKKENLID